MFIESIGEESSDSRTGSNYDGAGDDSEEDGFEADHEVVNAEKEIEGDFEYVPLRIRILASN